ncbi:hypothetical protein BJX61DRAFT_259900 [Aspergillus egyptiacus]|nr:hypothetical protein BJX61DRAFT_259900 [Aspergillus egyptiacus]
MDGLTQGCFRSMDGWMQGPGVLLGARCYIGRYYYYGFRFQKKYATDGELLHYYLLNWTEDETRTAQGLPSSPVPSSYPWPFIGQDIITAGYAAGVKRRDHPESRFVEYWL